jgi:flagellar motor switch/type III secretory pathway protein FliN
MSAATSVLAAHLEAAADSELTNPLYRSRGLKAQDLVWYWESAPKRPLSEWTVLTADDARIQVALDGDLVGLDCRLLDWRACTGETRLIAWTVRHEPLIELLRLVFRRDWMPESLGAGDNTHPSILSMPQTGDGAVPGRKARVQAGFRVFRADGPCIATGVVQLDPHLIEPSIARADFREPRLDSPLQRALAELPLILDEIEISRLELSAITSGCIVRLDNRSLAANPSRIQISAGSVRLIADATHTRATVVSFKGNPMSSTPSIDVEELPVRLDFRAGNLTVPFGSLCDIAPGYVFDLHKGLDDQVITVHANDMPIAIGELVTIGDLIGVRITRLLAKA